AAPPAPPPPSVRLLLLLPHPVPTTNARQEIVVTHAARVMSILRGWSGLRDDGDAAAGHAAGVGGTLPRVGAARPAGDGAVVAMGGVAAVGRVVAAVGAAVAAHAVGGQRRLADADLAVPANIDAGGVLRAARAGGRVVELGLRAGGQEQQAAHARD